MLSRLDTDALQDADHSTAAFISEMPENSLTYFESVSHCRIGAETCLALNRHGKSLLSLKLGSLDDAGVQSLGLLQDCTAIETLALSSSTASPDLKSTQNDTYTEIVSWLQNCNALQDISLSDFISAPDLLLPVLQNKQAKLQSLEISANNGEYISKDHHDFHRALADKPSLRSLMLKADPDPTSRDDIETLMNAFCSLKDLRQLRLYRISDYFSDEQIVMLTEHLGNLEDLDISGYGVSDKVWPSLAKLPLKVVNFSGITTFTTGGILEFIERLGESSRGLELSIVNADPDAAISQSSLDLIRDVLSTKLDGRLDYVLLRGLLLFFLRHQGLADLEQIQMHGKATRRKTQIDWSERRFPSMLSTACSFGLPARHVSAVITKRLYHCSTVDGIRAGQSDT